MTTGRPICSESFWPMMRASMSLPPPGGKPTMNRIGFDGYASCALSAAGLAVAYINMTAAPIIRAVLLHAGSSSLAFDVFTSEPFAEHDDFACSRLKLRAERRRKTLDARNFVRFTLHLLHADRGVSSLAHERVRHLRGSVAVHRYIRHRADPSG